MVAAGLLWAEVAHAQAAPPPPVPPLAPLPPAVAPTPAPPPAAPPLPKQAELADEHMQFVHHFAFGYLGISTLPIAASGSATAPPIAGTVNAPVIGVRYWFSERLGLDAGVGFGWSSATDQPTSYGGALHAGLPIALHHVPHFTVELIPELTGGLTGGTIKIPAQNDANVGGLLLRVGGRAAAEVHFGFIGIPALALQASIGVYYEHTNISFNQSGIAQSGSANLATTTVDGAPWAIFTNGIAALYYF